MNVFDETSQPAGPRAAQKQATRRRVLAAAKEEFERVGFDAANLRAIAAQAGISAGTVIHHYRDKRELLHAALFDDLERTLGRALAQLGDGPLASQLEALTRAMFRYYQRRPQLSRTLLKESLFADPPWAERFSGQVARVHGVIEGLVREAIASQRLRVDTVPALFAAAYFSYFYFALIAWAQGAHPHPVDLVTKLVESRIIAAAPAAARPTKNPPTRRKRP